MLHFKMGIVLLNCFNVISGYRAYKLIFKAHRDKNLFTANNLKAMCELERKVIPHTDSGCHPYSVGFYAGVIVNKDCLELSDADVEYVKVVLERCRANESFMIQESCENCTSEQLECRQYGAVNMILSLHSDLEFSKHERLGPLKYSMTLYKYSKLEGGEYYMKHLRHQKLKNDQVKIVGLNVGNRFAVFNKYLIADLKYFIIAIFIVTLIIFLYTRSIILAIASLFNLVIAFGISYLFYYDIYGMDFFPFMNILSALILIAVGSDDIFVIFDNWQEMKQTSLSQVDRLYAVYRHAGSSILVTSLTTSAALFGNTISSITALKCFGVFSGTIIIIHFLITIIMIPALLCGAEVVQERFCSQWTFSFLDKPLRILTIVRTTIFEVFLPKSLKIFWHSFLVIYLVIGIGSFIIIFYEPKFSLPTTKTLQAFESNHPLEMYSAELRNNFNFHKQTLLFREHRGMDALAIWGVQSKDNGNVFNPDDRGTLKMNDKFNMNTPASQLWHQQFCHRLKEAPFVKPSTRDLNCTMDMFASRISSECTQNTTTCCNHTFPVSEEIFKSCFPQIYAEISCSQATYLGGAFFDKNNNVKAYNVFFVLNTAFSTSYPLFNSLYNSLENFMYNESIVTPSEVTNGFFYSDFSLLDLQKSISSTTLSSCVLSLCVAFVVIFIMSLNTLLACYAFVNILFAFISTLSMLVLLDWELNIIESVTITLSIGLSVDITIHYMMAYKLSEAKDRTKRTIHALSRVGAAASMATLTTFIVGACVMGANIMPYLQLGIFMMIVMLFSWILSSFGFLSLCYRFGPQSDFLQFRLPFCKSEVKPVIEELCNDIMEDVNTKPTENQNETDNDKRLENDKEKEN